MELTEAQYLKHKIVTQTAEVLVNDLSKEDGESLRFFLNQVVNFCKQKGLSHTEILTIIHNDIAGRVMGPQTPEEFEQKHGPLEDDWPLPKDWPFWEPGDFSIATANAAYPCPECKGEMSQYRNIGRDHWGVCLNCRITWYIGSNLFSSYREETEAAWEENKTYLSQFRVVGSIPSPGHLFEASF